MPQITPRDVTIGKDTYRILYNTAALCRLEELADEAFWTFRDRLRTGGIKMRDAIILLAAGLEGARVAMFRKSPAWTLERTAELFDAEEAQNVEDFIVQYGPELTRAMVESFVTRVARKDPDGAKGANATPLDGSPLAGSSSGSDTSTPASKPA